MDWTKHDAVATEWRRRSEAYARAIREYVARGEAEGWERAGEQPADRRADLADRVLDIVREANAAGAWRELRERVPPAHEPYVKQLRAKAIGAERPAWIDDRRVVVHVGTAWLRVGTFVLDLDGGCEAHPDVFVGRSADRRWFARVGDDGVRVCEGFDGPVRCTLALPPRDADAPRPLDVLVFPDGRRALVVLEDGVHLCGVGAAARLFPAAGDGEEQLSMVHAALSPDGRAIAVGHQGSQHVVLRPDGGLVARFGPLGSEYPHHASFSPDGTVAIFNACHFYNGATVRVATADLPGLHVEPYGSDPRIGLLQGGARVYASAWIGGAPVLGDAYGYLRGVTPDGAFAWDHFCGSTIGGIDLSPDGRHLAVATAAGYLQLLAVDDPRPDPYRIGRSPHRERLRFVWWKDEPLLRW